LIVLLVFEEQAVEWMAERKPRNWKYMKK